MPKYGKVDKKQILADFRITQATARVGEKIRAGDVADRGAERERMGAVGIDEEEAVAF